MKITDFDSLDPSTYDAVVVMVKQNHKAGVLEALKQLDPMQHDVMKPSKRPNKIISIDDPDNPERDIKKRVEVARLPLPFQKIITNRGAAFLCGNPITYQHDTLTESQEAVFEVFEKVIEDNKLSYKDLDLAYKMMGETETAEIWYTEPVDLKNPNYWDGTPAAGAKYRLRMKIIAHSLGDRLYPVYDEYGDLIAFGHGYEVTEGMLSYEHFDIYTATVNYKGIRTNLSGSWTLDIEPNMVGKIPVIYYSQEKPEWSDVQRLIERLEVCASNNADVNDYNGSPILVAKGQVQGFSAKGESGKVLEISGSGDVNYLTWDNAPESVKNELEWVTKMIYDMTDTPNISMGEMKALSVYSGIALKMLFLAAHMKAATKEGIFGESTQRRANYIKKAISVIKVSLAPASNFKIKPKFKYFMPENTAEMIDTLSTAVGGEPIMSQKAAVGQNPLITDPVGEYQEMTDEGKIGPAVSVV